MLLLLCHAHCALTFPPLYVHNKNNKYSTLSSSHGHGTWYPSLVLNYKLSRFCCLYSMNIAMNEKIEMLAMNGINKPIFQLTPKSNNKKVIVSPVFSISMHFSVFRPDAFSPHSSQNLFIRDDFSWLYQYGNKLLSSRAS